MMRRTSCLITESTHGGLFSLKRRMESICTGLITVFLSLCLLPTILNAQEDLRERFLKQAPKAWNEYRLLAQRLDGTISASKTIGQKPYLHVRSEYKHNRNCRLCLEQSLLPESPNGELVACNNKYAFQLVRKSTNGLWVVQGIEEKREDGDGLYKEVRDQLTPVYWLVRAHSENLADLVRQPNFRILSAVAINQYGTDLVQITFDNTHQEPVDGKPYFTIQSGKLVLDPARHWCLRACELHNKHSNADAKIKIETDLQDGVAGFPIPRHSLEVSDQMRQDGRLVLTSIWDFELNESTSLPSDDEFTLAAFGLPEPFPGTPPHGHWYLWLALAGGSGLVLAMLFVWLKNRALRRAA